MYQKDFWCVLDRLVADTELVIDRPKSSTHPRFPDYVYPLDYGYLKGTSAMDGDGIDVWLGSVPERGIVAVICTVDLFKRDSEIKILLGCTEEEIRTVEADHNQSDGMKGLLIRRYEK